jgi:hypothetical protein
MTIGTSGNVGIGTTNPTTTLYVTGTATVTTSINSSRYDVGGGVALSTISTTLYIANYSSWTKVAFCYGDVGIGVLSPTAVLHLKAGTAAANTAPLKFTSGPINTSAEVGTQEYNGVFHQTKYGSIRYTLGGILNSQYTSVSNAGAGEDDLHTYTVLRDTLSSDGSLIEFVFTLSFAANANSKQVRSYLGSTKIYDSTAQVQSGGVMIISGIIIRTGATGQIVIINTTNTAAVPLFSSGASYVIGTETLANDLVLKTTAEAVNDADATQLSSTVKYGGY